MLRKTLALRAGALTVVLTLAACAGGGSPTKAPTSATPLVTPTSVASVPAATINATPAAAETTRIAYGVKAGGGGNIFSVVPDGTDKQQLTTGSGYSLCPSYSADASLIEYCSDASGDFEIWTMKPDGTGQAQLTHLEGAAYFPDASHDGKKVAFGGIQGDDPNTEIYVVNAATGDGLVALTSCDGLLKGCSNDLPAWSPNDKQIVYIHADDMDANENAINSQVWTMNADGSNQHPLTTDSTPKDQVPNWSPDGSSIAYANGSGSTEGIWTMKSDGSSQHQLSGCRSTDTSPCASAGDFGPVWSPDGTRIAFLRSFLNVGTDDRPIYVMNADGSDEHRVMDEHVLAGIPSWR